MVKLLSHYQKVKFISRILELDTILAEEIKTDVSQEYFNPFVPNATLRFSDVFRGIENGCIGN